MVQKFLGLCLFTLVATSASAGSTSEGLVQVQTVLERLDEVAPGSLAPSELSVLVSQLRDAADEVATDAGASRFSRQHAERLLLLAATRLLHRHAEPTYARDVVEAAKSLLAEDLSSPSPKIQKLAQARLESLDSKSSTFSSERSGFHLDRTAPAAAFSFSTFSVVPVCDSDDP